MAIFVPFFGPFQSNFEPNDQWWTPGNDLKMAVNRPKMVRKGPNLAKILPLCQCCQQLSGKCQQLAGIASWGLIWAKRLLYWSFWPFFLWFKPLKTFLGQIIVMRPLFCPETSFLRNKKMTKEVPWIVLVTLTHTHILAEILDTNGSPGLILQCSCTVQIAQPKPLWPFPCAH